MYLDKMVIVEVKVIFAGMKQLKQFQIKPRKKALMGFEPMTSMIPGAMLYQLSYEA